MTFHKIEAPVRGDQVLLAGRCQEPEGLAVRIWGLSRRAPMRPQIATLLLQLVTSALVRSGSFCIGKDANLLWLDDRGCAEVHVDVAGCDQQVNLVRFRNTAGPSPTARCRRIPGSASTAALMAGSTNPVDARRVESQIVFQELEVSLENPVDLRR